MSAPNASDPLAALSAAGVSIWLDDLSRELLAGGELRKLITDRHVVGVTTNPTIFASALSKGDRYNEQLGTLGGQGASVDDAVFALTTDDVREGCDVFEQVFARTGGVDGRVSLEVDPRLAQDADATAVLARKLWETVDRPNLFIKIPATRKGLKAITAVIAEGISVNVTLIFSLERYREVMDAYQSGLEQARAAGRDLADIHSVASFFVSRVDSEVDRRLNEIGTNEAQVLKGKAAIANARLAYQAYGRTLAEPRWRRLAEAGARVQRPLWASTGIKDPSYGSEVQIALDARALLASDGVAVRVVSMPCREWFAAQPPEYRDQVLPPEVRARVSVEAAIGQGWREMVGDAGRIVSLEHYGASADYQGLYTEFGITPEAVAQAARDSIADTDRAPRPGGHQETAAPTSGGTGDRP